MATLVHGEPLKLKHTPSGALDAGEVIEVGGRALIAVGDIAANTLGDVAAFGGVYDVIAGEALTAGEEVYMTISSQKVFDATGAATGDPHFGYVAPSSSAGGADVTVRVVHMPSGAQAS